MTVEYSADALKCLEKTNQENVDRIKAAVSDLDLPPVTATNYRQLVMRPKRKEGMLFVGEYMVVFKLTDDTNILVYAIVEIPRREEV